jgi:hypothetical protein
MHVAARARLVLARRPWIYWAVVAVLAGLAAATMQGQIGSVAVERDRWGTTRTVLVSTDDLEPGDPVVAAPTALPIAALPDSALDELPDGAIVRQRVAAGEVLTRVDVTARGGPAALAEPGTVVVALSDPLARNVAVGFSVQVSADGLVVADDARITAVVDDVVFVAVSERDGPGVAAAAQQGIASLLYLP